MEQVAEWLGPRDDFAIASHADPDGDSLGSSLALAFALEQVGKRSTVVIGQSLPRRYGWLPGASRVVSTSHVPADSRATILVECSDFARSGVLGLDTLEALNIDHHTKNAMYADVNWIDSSAAATGMMILELATALGAELTADMAALLYVAVLTDTGSFQHSNTDARAMAFASKMLAHGAKASEISEQVYGDYPAARIHLLGDALSSLKRIAGGRIAYMFLPFSAFERRRTRPGHRWGAGQSALQGSRTWRDAHQYPLRRQRRCRRGGEPSWRWRSSTRRRLSNRGTCGDGAPAPARRVARGA